MLIWEIKDHAWTPRETTNEENAYMSAWDKIQAWVAENCSYDEEKRFDLPFNPYSKTALCVIYRNKACIKKGSHGWDYSNFVNEPNRYESGDYGKYDQDVENAKLSSITFNMIKAVVDNWKELKKKIVSLNEQLNDVFHFCA